MIEFVLQTILANILVATILASLAMVVARTRRWPAIVHALWVLVLIKLITPPIVPISVDALGWHHAQSITLSPDSDTTLLSASASNLDDQTRSRRGTINLLAALGFFWAFVSSLLFVVFARRTICFLKLLRCSRVGGKSFDLIVQRLSEQIGITHAPEVRVTEKSISPLIWVTPFNRTVLLPARLIDRVDQRGIEAILLHELAHLRRADHWVRLFETITTVLFWWNPLVWIARRQIRITEEMCCDAWVVSLIPSSAAIYARTLIETADILAANHISVPSIASGVGPVTSLRRRIFMIMQGNTMPDSIYRARAWFLVLASCFIPLTPLLGHTETPKKPESTSIFQPLKQEKDQRKCVFKECKLRHNDDGKFDCIIQLEDGSIKTIRAGDIANGSWLKSLNDKEDLQKRLGDWNSRLQSLLDQAIENQK